jgi:hypothetical protein
MENGHQKTVAVKCDALDLMDSVTQFRRYMERATSVEHVRNIPECLAFLNVTSVLFVIDETTLSDDVCQDLIAFVNGGGRCAVLLRCDMSREKLSNVNYLIEQFGVCGNADVAIDCVYRDGMDPEQSTGHLSQSSESFLYPHGCTLTVQEPAKILAITSRDSYPVSQPVCAYTLMPGGGRFVVMGSSHVLCDAYFTSGNRLVHSILIPFLLEDAWVPPEHIPANELPPYRLIPDLLYMVELDNELEEPIEDPFDNLHQFKPRWPTVDEDLIAEVSLAYDLLKVPLQPLSVSFSLNPSHFLLPELGYSPIVVDNNIEDSEYDKIPLFDLHHFVQGSPPLEARTEDEIEYALNSSDPKLKLLDLAKLFVTNSREF